MPSSSDDNRGAKHVHPACLPVAVVSMAGKCEDCGTTTSWSGQKFCPNCAKERGVCQICKQKLETTAQES